MTVNLNTCVYCETSVDEIIASGAADTKEDALKFVSIADHAVLLCPACRVKYASAMEDDVDELLNGPITFPPGVTAVQHTCPELEFKGVPSELATSTLVMERKGDYYVATCPHCEVTIRSLAEDDEL